MRRVLLIATEPASSLPWSPAQRVLRALTETFVDDTLRFTSLTPPRTLAMTHEIVGAVDVTDATHVVVLSNALHNLELVLYRMASNRWPHEPDNDGEQRDGKLLAEADEMLISTTPVMHAWHAWHARSDEFTHVTLNMGTDEGLENVVAYRLMHGLDLPVAQIGVPPIQEGHPLLEPARVVETALFLVDQLTA